MTLTFAFKRQAMIADGVYEATLRRINETKRKMFESEEMEDVLEFSYAVHVDDSDPIEIKRNVRPILNPKSKLVADLKAMVGNPAVEAARGSDEKLTELLMSLVGKSFQVQVEANDKGYSNIKAVMAKPKSAFDKPAPKPAKPLQLEPESMKKAQVEDDDDINF
jgi:hypothetical protein